MSAALFLYPDKTLTKRTTDQCRRMINTSARGYYVNGTISKVRKIIEDVAVSKQGHDCNNTSPKDVPKEDTEDESLKQQTQIKAMLEAMMENVTNNILKQLQPLILPKQNNS